MNLLGVSEQSSSNNLSEVDDKRERFHTKVSVADMEVLADTFPTNKFLMNGLILGIKGLLSFMSAPLVGSLSDLWGRKFFLILTVFCTCMPIPCLKISPWWYFALFSISGLFSVTFSVVLAYVADITDKADRSSAYGLVSATFAASLVTSPALGAYISESYSDGAVVALATLVATVDVLFIMIHVPESLQLRKSHDSLSWQSADPFSSLRLVWHDADVLKLSLIVFLSYLPEAGQFSCFFVYLKLVVGFSPEAVAAFIALVGVLSVFAQTVMLQYLSIRFGIPATVSLGLSFQLAQLSCYGLATQYWIMWAAGILAALSSITYPSISAHVSLLSDKDKQGTVQGVVTGIRGLCQGFGPAIFGFIFYLCDVDLTADGDGTGHVGVGPAFPAPRIRPVPLTPKILIPRRNETVEWSTKPAFDWMLVPGPPFLAGAFLVLVAIICNSAITPSTPTSKWRRLSKSPTSSRRNSAGSDDCVKLLQEPHL